MDAMTFVSLQDPANPLYLGELPLTEGATANMWRDLKVYADHAFIVADGAGPHGVQIFDLRQLRDVENPPVTFGETAHYDGIFSAHNIVMNEGSGFAYVVGASDLPPRVVPHPMLVPAPVEGREGRASSGTRVTA